MNGMILIFVLRQICRYELCLYPRYHLDEASLLCRKQLPGKPIAMDVWQDYILVTCPPFDIYVFKVHVQGELSSQRTATVQASFLAHAIFLSIKLNRFMKVPSLPQLICHFSVKVKKLPINMPMGRVQPFLYCSVIMFSFGFAALHSS